MRRSLRLVVALAFLGLGVAIAPTRVSADCSGESTCVHSMLVWTSGSSLVYDAANDQLSSGNSDGGTWNMQRDVYPYSDHAGGGAGFPCQAISALYYNLGGYGLHAHYSFQASPQAGKCDGTTAFNHTHPTSSTFYTVYWTGQSLYCYSNEQGGWNGTC